MTNFITLSYSSVMSCYYDVRKKQSSLCTKTIAKFHLKKKFGKTTGVHAESSNLNGNNAQNSSCILSLTHHDICETYTRINAIMENKGL